MLLLLVSCSIRNFASVRLPELVSDATARIFAFPCGALKIGDKNYYDLLKNDFIGARGINPGLQTAKEVNLDNIESYMINGQVSRVYDKFDEFPPVDSTFYQSNVLVWNTFQHRS